MHTKSDSAIEIASLTLRRGGKLLFEEMSWKLPRGSFLAVTGASGTGKSSFLDCLSGTLHPISGTVELCLSESRSVGIVFQNFRLTGNSSVLTNVLCGRLNAYSWRQTLFSFPEIERRKAFSILCELGLEDLLHRQVRSISGGEQQRTALARVLLQDPEIIQADEPTSNLDADLAKRVLALFRRKCTQEERTIIAVLHNTQMVESFADYELKIGPEHENGWCFRHIPK